MAELTRPQARRLRAVARDVGASVREVTRLLRDLDAAVQVAQESVVACAATVDEVARLVEGERP